MCAHMFHCVRAQIFTTLFLVVLYYPMSLSFQFYKDPSFCCEDIHKIIWTFV